MMSVCIYRMSFKDDDCDIFVDLSHKPQREIRKAAIWAKQSFNYVDVGCRGPEGQKGFWFFKQKDADWFKLRWLA